MFKFFSNIFSITNFLIQELFPTIGRALNLTILDKKFEKVNILVISEHYHHLNLVPST